MGSKMTRVLLAAAVFISALALDLRPVQAYGDGPWCAVVSIGRGAMQEDCHYRSIEECRPNVIAGNRGFCNPNPRWQPRAAEPRRRHGKRRVRPH